MVVAGVHHENPLLVDLLPDHPGRGWYGGKRARRAAGILGVENRKAATTV
jgi:hypothetical protein